MSARLSKSGPLRGERRRRLARSSTGGPETMRGGSSSRKHRGVRPPGPPRRPVVAFADAPQSPADMVGGGGALSQQQLQQQHLGGGRYSPVVLPQQQRGAGAGGGRPPVGMGHAAARRRKMAGPGSGGDGQPVGFSAGGTPAQWAERVRGPPPGSPGSGRLEPLENAPQARCVRGLCGVRVMRACGYAHRARRTLGELTPVVSTPPPLPSSCAQKAAVFPAQPAA